MTQTQTPYGDSPEQRRAILRAERDRINRAAELIRVRLGNRELDTEQARELAAAILAIH